MHWIRLDGKKKVLVPQSNLTRLIEQDLQISYFNECSHSHIAVNIKTRRAKKCRLWRPYNISNFFGWSHTSNKHCNKYLNIDGKNEKHDVLANRKQIAALCWQLWIFWNKLYFAEAHRIFSVCGRDNIPVCYGCSTISPPPPPTLGWGVTEGISDKDRGGRGRVQQGSLLKPALVSPDKLACWDFNDNLLYLLFILICYIFFQLPIFLISAMPDGSLCSSKKTAEDH